MPFKRDTLVDRVREDQRLREVCRKAADGLPSGAELAAAAAYIGRIGISSVELYSTLPGPPAPPRSGQPPPRLAPARLRCATETPA